jgi:hypothetical protein
MLKGLKGIFEKIVDVAVPVLGNMIGGPWGAALGGGVLAALKGKNTKDIVTNAALSWGGAKAFGGGPQAMTSVKPKQATGGNPFTEFLFGSKGESPTGGTYTNPGVFNKIGDAMTGNWGEAIATGLPSILGYLGAKEDAKKAGPDMSEMDVVSEEYGGKTAGPPAAKRVGNMKFVGFDDEGNPQYENFAQGGEVAVEEIVDEMGGPAGMTRHEWYRSSGELPFQEFNPDYDTFKGVAPPREVAVEEIVDEMGGPDRVSYSAYTGLPALADGGRPVDRDFYKNIRTAERGVRHLANGGNTKFPRRTGTIQGPGTKTSDSIPAMLSDGEFVQRTDAVNGAGVMMGARNAAEAQKKGAEFMYALQDKLANMGNRVA